MAQAVLSPSQLATFAFNRGACRYFGREPVSPGPEELEIALTDLRKVQGDALIVGGIAVIHYGYERVTKDIDLLYAHSDSKILERLKPFFKVVVKAKSGWHTLEHRKNKVCLELIPEGGLGRCGLIPGPQLAGQGHEGVVSLYGLVWLKLIASRPNDMGDLYRLAQDRLDDMRRIVTRLPDELRPEFDSILKRAEEDLKNDPHRRPDKAQEAPKKYGKKKALRKKRTG
ncbi:MAG: hypothetical protein M5U26_25330 [Planctomycetota bacterium]|nr:hypothetical protein [Planctomycetota bacterium]